MTTTEAAAAGPVEAGGALRFGDGVRRRFHALWLRDNASGDRDPRNGQRLGGVAGLPADRRLRGARLDGDRLQALFDGDGGGRRLPGCYAGRDGLLSTLAALTEPDDTTTTS